MSDSHFEGTYSTNLGGFPVKISVCERDDKYYLASRRLISNFETSNYIHMVGRSTKVTHKYITFDETFALEGDEEVIKKSITIRFYDGEYTLTGADEKLTKIKETALDCFAPQKNWEDVETPLLTESVDLTERCPSIGTTSCLEVNRMDDVAKDGKACWGFYDLINDKYEGGGTLSKNVKLEWDGGLRILCWEDESEPETCASGCEFEVWTSKVAYLLTYNCVGTDGKDVLHEGSIYTQYTACSRVCDDVGIKCPLFEKDRKEKKKHKKKHKKRYKKWV